MTTACWGTNASFDCAWVYFGYGSRYDMIGDYHKGWWVSLDALKVLVKYDYAFTPEHCPSPKVIHNIYEPNWYNKDKFIKEKMEDYIICEKYGIDDYYEFIKWKGDGDWEYDYEKWDTMPLLLQMRTTAIHINHPNAAEWFGELKKHSGLFMKENPNYKETCYYNGGEQAYESSTPSLRAIKNINYADWEIISRVEYMNQQAMEGEPAVEREVIDHTGFQITQVEKFDNAEDMFKELDFGTE
jgi:hypothetical protein